MSTGGERLKRKCAFVLKVVLWSVVFILNTGFCMPGIIIALQYHNDACITDGGVWNLFIDYWLLIGSVFQFAIPFMTLPCVCFHFDSNYVFRTFMVVSDVLLGAWVVFGVYLVANSDLKSCEHDSLWVMSIIFIVSVALWILFQIIYITIRTINNRCGSDSGNERYHQLWTSNNQGPEIEELFFNDNHAGVQNYPRDGSNHYGNSSETDSLL